MCFLSLCVCVYMCVCMAIPRGVVYRFAPNFESGINTGRPQGTYVVPGFKPGSALCIGSILLAVP